MRTILRVIAVFLRRITLLRQDMLFNHMMMSRTATSEEEDVPGQTNLMLNFLKVPISTVL